MLIDWTSMLRKKRGGTKDKSYSPATLNMKMQSFFFATREYYNWDFVYADFKFDGGFNGFFKALCAKRQKENVSKKSKNEN